MFRYSTILLAKQKELELKKVEIPTHLQARNTLLSWVVPVEPAIALYNTLFGPTVMQGNFKKFVDEMEANLNVTGSSPAFIKNLIPEYLSLRLRNKMHTGDLLNFRYELEHDLHQAYESSLDQSVRDRHKVRVFNKIMLKLGPRGLKYIQSMRPKNPNHWLSEAIGTAQSDLPAVALPEVEKMLKEAFRIQGTLEYVDRFAEHFEVVKILGAGTIGITAAINFKEKPSEKSKELVAKFVRPGTIEELIQDNNQLNQAADLILKLNRATPQETATFKEINEKKLAEALREANPNLENAHLLESPYQGPGVTTVSGNLELAGKASNVVFMDKAQGVELAKYLKKLRTILANPELPEEERKKYLSQIAALRKRYCQLAEIHLSRVSQNLSVHADMHSGNLFYDENAKLISVLDLGAVARPVNETEHLQLRQFLFYINLSAGTADVEYLRMYYQKYHNSPDTQAKKIDPAKIEIMLNQIQKKLSEINDSSQNQSTIHSEKCINEIISIITNAALANGTDIIPNALINLVRSNQLIGEELAALTKDLWGSQFASQIPYSERTQMAIALKASWKQKQTKNSDLWTQETWNYFYQNVLCLRGGIKQLQFEKKFIYGIFGLSEREAAMADVLIPGALISAPLVIYLASKKLHKGVKFAYTKLPELAQSYQMFKAFKIKFGSGLSTQEIFQKFNEVFLSNQNVSRARTKIQNSVNAVRARAESFGHTLKQNRPHLPIGLKPMTSSAQRLFAHPALRKFAPGVAVGAAALYGAQSLYQRKKK